ncbi:type I-F CRISPR-associated protein Csy2, partial [Vibrio parahaemolyticus]
RLLILPHIRIHNANALSSPFTIGFPAMTAWLGFTHALERKLNQAGLDELMFDSVAVVSHQFDLQTHKGEGDFVHSIIGTGNPLDKDGSRSAFIEEARCHLEVSLV